nr:hypothetical protein [Tanacetum cinerariifolium]
MNQLRKKEDLLAEQELREQEQAAQEKEEPLQNSDIRQLIREVCGIKICEEQKQNMEDTMLELLEVCRQKELYCMHNDVDDLIESALNSKLLSINLKSQRLDKKKQEVKNKVEQPTKRRTRIIESLQSFRVIHKKSSISLNNTSQISPVNAIAPVLQTEEPKSLHDSELISLEEENDVYQEEKEIDLEDILQIHDVILREKLLSINCLITEIEFLNDNPTPDRDDSFEDIDYVEASPPDSELVGLEEVKDEILRVKLLNIHLFIDKIDNHTEETSSGSTTTHADNSLFEYDSFLFEIEPNQGELTSVAMKAIVGEPRIYVPNVLPTHPTLYQDLDFSSSYDSLGSDLEVSFPFRTRNKIFDPRTFIKYQSERPLSREEFSISFIRDTLCFDQFQPPQYSDVHKPSKEISIDELKIMMQSYFKRMNQLREQEDLLAAQEKEEPPQNSDIRQLIREVCGIKVCEEQKQNMEDTMLEARITESLENFRVIHKKSSISLNNTSQISPVNAITPVLPTEELEYSLSMGDKHLNTTPKTESDEIIKSSVENLVAIPSEYEGIFENTCDVPVCEDSSTFDVLKDHYEILSNSNNDDTSSDDDALRTSKKEIDLEDILQIQDVIIREKLLSINRLIADIEFLNDNPTPDRVLKSSSSFPIFEKSDNSLSYSDNSLPE